MNGISVEAVEGVALRWGESARWDERRRRLWFVDCLEHRLSWLDHGTPPMGSMRLPSMPTGIVLTDGDELLICLADGIHVVDADHGTSELLAPYPPEMRGRANDAAADGVERLITGTLNLGPGEGSMLSYSTDGTWTVLDETIVNTNGPVVHCGDDHVHLFVNDTAAATTYRYDYDLCAGTVSRRSVFATYTGGVPDGAVTDGEGNLWVCVPGRGALRCIRPDGTDHYLDLPARNPSSITFGGPRHDQLYVTTIATGAGPGPLLRVDGTGSTGVRSPLFALRAS